MSAIRVVIVDDHALLREGIRALLKTAPDIEVVGEAADGVQAIEACRRLEPDVVLMDVTMPGLGGLEATLEIRKQVPRTRVLVITNLHNPSRAFTSPGDLRAVGDTPRSVGGRVLVDEVYLEAPAVRGRPFGSAAHLGPEFVVTSSLAKAYGLCWNVWPPSSRGFRRVRSGCRVWC